MSGAIEEQGQGGARMSDTPLLRVNALTKSFSHQGRELQVLRGVTLDLAAGDAVAVVGSSGAGKSTLLHLLGALDRPSAGEIFFDGAPLSALNDDEVAAFRNREVGFIFQFHHLLQELTALENVCVPGLIARRQRKEVREAAEQWLVRVGLKERLTHRPSELSGGEQQRVALARALVNRPRLLLADEPTGNLDQRTSEEIHRLLEEVNREEGMTLLVVTHNPALAARLPRRLVMRDGLLVAQDEEKVE
ncbi:MAG: ABC transporter ATP-binding protein [Myxococcota bacterium]|nr:ABC transporter ATP-binding protein [Myxococcota bacterium]